jgi:hypothetical protein
MIISYSRGFIFMHSRKTAGSTITAALNRYLAPQDIQLGAWPDTLAAGGRLNRTAARIALRAPALLWPSLKRSLKAGRPTIAAHEMNDVIRRHYLDKGLRAGTHSSARDVRQFDPAHWERAFKFCFVRNPWTHAVSDYHWRCHATGTEPVGFKEFLYRLRDPERPDPERLRPPVITNWSIYTLENEIALDHVARYEDLQAELAYIGSRIGLKIDIAGIRSKGNLRNRKADIKSYYDDEAVELVRDIYSAEIEAFGYAPFV